MLNQLSLTEKLAAAVATCVIATVLLFLILGLSIPQNYSDFIVGSITWTASSKLQDLIVAPVLIITSIISFNLFAFLIKNTKNDIIESDSSSFSNQLIWCSLPSIAAIFSQALGNGIDKNIFLISTIGIVFVSTACWHKAYKEVKLEAIGLVAFSIILCSLIPLEIVLLINRTSIFVIDKINSHRVIDLGYLFTALILTLGLVFVIYKPKNLTYFLPKALFLGQVGLPLFFLSLFPAKLLQEKKLIVQYETTIWLKALVITFISWGLVDVFYRYRRYSKTTHYSQLLSPVALFSLLLGLRFSNSIAPNISIDDYHFGEQLIGWWSYIQGRIPYVDYIPAHGLIDDDLNMFLSSIFYDGSAGSIEEASRHSFALLAFVAFISIYYFSNSLGLAFVSTFFLGGRLSWFFLTPFLCLWFNSSVRANSSKWLSVWIVSAPIVILGVPPQGLLIVASSLVMVAYFIGRLLIYPNERNWISIIGSIFILSIVSLVIPLASMLTGAINYVLENGPINQIAYGIPWNLSLIQANQNGLLFEAVRMSWIAIPIACLSILYVIAKDSKKRKDTALPVIVVLIFTLLLIPYSMGRIDPGGISRPGLATIFGWTILLPISIWAVIKPTYKVPLLLLIASISATLNFAPLSISNLVTASSAQIDTPLLRDGQSVGLPNIGKAYVQDEHWDRLSRLNAILKENLSLNDTYLDLTSRNAQYFYLNRKPEVAVTAPYNMVPVPQQKRAVQKLSSNLPKIALLEGANIIHDGGGLALRNPYLYRFVVDNYIPRYEKGFIIGFSNKQWEDNNKLEIDVTPKNLTDLNWELGIHRSEAAIIIDDPGLISIIKIGDQVVLRGGDVRRVQRVWNEGSAIWLDGNPLEPSTVGYPANFKVIVTSEALLDYRDALFQRAFSQSELNKIPIAWGLSLNKLERKMEFVTRLDQIKPSFNQLTSENGSYKVTGSDPFINFDVSNLGLSGRNAGLLSFDFSCIGKTTEPRIQIFWWGDHHLDASERSSLRFTANEGSIIVPLDSSSYWINQKTIHGLRIDLDNANACQRINIKNIKLWNRNFK